MKIRTDFVTNSSSSSFIIGYNSKKYDNPFGALFDELDKRVITDNRINILKTAIKNGDKADLESLALITEAGWDFYRSPHPPYDTPEFDEAKRKYLEKEAEKIKERAKTKGFDKFISIEISDHASIELEHEIMPSLSCTLKRYSHH